MVLSCFSPPPQFFFPSFIPRPRFLPPPPPAFVLRRQTSLQPWYLDVECNNVLRGGGEGEGIKFILFNSFDRRRKRKEKGERGRMKRGEDGCRGWKWLEVVFFTNCYELFRTVREKEIHWLDSHDTRHVCRKDVSYGERWRSNDLRESSQSMVSRKISEVFNRPRRHVFLEEKGKTSFQFNE